MGEIKVGEGKGRGRGTGGRRAGVEGKVVMRALISLLIILEPPALLLDKVVSVLLEGLPQPVPWRARDVSGTHKDPAKGPLLKDHSTMLHHRPSHRLELLDLLLRRPCGHQHAIKLLLKLGELPIIRVDLVTFQAQIIRTLVILGHQCVGACARECPFALFAFGPP